MKIRTMSLNAALIVASITFLILIARDGAAAWSLGANRNAGSTAEGHRHPEMGCLRSVTMGMAVPALFDLSFRVYRNGVLEPVSSLPVSGGPLVLFAHVEDANGNPAQSGTVDFEYCGDYEPKEACESGSARWHRLGRISIGSCYCRSCGGLPNYDPGPGNACIFVFGAGNIAGDDGFRFKFAGRRGGVDNGMSSAANFAWTSEP